jgi:hypothetical protein
VSVFAHWTKRNQQHPTYDDIKSGVRDRGISIRRIVAEIDWGHFTPLTREECMQVPVRSEEVWDAKSDRE